MAMRRLVLLLTVAVVSSAAADAGAQVNEGGRVAAPIVFFDIAGEDSAAQAAFYREVFGWDVGAGGRLSVNVHSPLSGTLRTDPAEKVIYIGVADVTATLDRVVEHGGAITAPRFEVPGVVVLGLFTDPAGNRMGLVELDGDRARIP